MRRELSLRLENLKRHLKLINLKADRRLRKVKSLKIKKLTVVALLFFFFCNSWATHNRAGEITYVQLSDLSFEITITTYTYTLSFADRPQLEISWGDNTSSIADRISILYLPNYYKRNIYKITHTFPGPGVYQLVMSDPNRNANILNIPNSVNVQFSISTILIVNPAIVKSLATKEVFADGNVNTTFVGAASSTVAEMSVAQ